MDKLIRNLQLWNLRLTVAALVIGAGSLALNWRNLPPQVPLLYSRPWGQDQLIHPVWLWLLPGASLLSGVIVGFLSPKIVGEGVLRVMVLATGIVAEVIFTIGLLRIILLVA